MKKIKFEDILVQLGTGKWNSLHFCGVSLYFFAVPSFIIATVFLVPNVPFDCDIPSSLNESTVSVDQCSYTVLSNYSMEEANVTVVKCTSWVYHQEEYAETMTSEFNLVCDRAYLRPTYQSIFMLGILTGSPLNGFLGDRYGRKTALSIASTVAVTSIWISSFMSYFPFVLATRFISGLVVSGLFQSGFALCMEITVPRRRSFVGILLALPRALGTIWWGFLGYLIRDWRWAQRASTAPCFLFFICLLFMDESPRWSIVNGHHKQALRTLQKAFTWNGSAPPPATELLENMRHIQMISAQHSKGETGNCAGPRRLIKKLFSFVRTPAMRKRYLLMIIICPIVISVFAGMTLNAANFNFNPYVYLATAGLAQVPAYTLPAPIIARVGRIRPLSTLLLMCGAAIMAIAFASGPAWLVTAFMVAGLFSIAAAFQIISLLLVELFPTEIRLLASGSCTFVGNVMAISTPFITELLGLLYPKAPSYIFGSLCLIAGVIALHLPETLNKRLPDTISQLENDANKKIRIMESRDGSEKLNQIECKK